MNIREWLYNLPFFPKKKISQVDVQLIREHLIKIFKDVGMPKNIKVDNGRPFGDPERELITPLSLWLIGLGINVIRNRPRQPTDNAVVERSQGVMAKWTEYEKCKNTTTLQKRLLKEADFHNFHFPIRRKGNKTRIQYFPSMMHTGIKWNPNGFDLQRVIELVAKGKWERKVSGRGQFYIYGQRHYIGYKYKHQRISTKLDQSTNMWNVYDSNGNLITSKPSPFSLKNFKRLDFS